MKKTLILSSIVTLLLACSAPADDHKKGEDKKAADAEAPAQMESPKGAKVYLLQPREGKTMKTKFKVAFGLKGMGIAPAGI